MGEILFFLFPKSRRRRAPLGCVKKIFRNRRIGGAGGGWAGGGFSRDGFTPNSRGFFGTGGGKAGAESGAGELDESNVYGRYRTFEFNRRLHVGYVI